MSLIHQTFGDKSYHVSVAQSRWRDAEMPCCSIRCAQDTAQHGRTAPEVPCMLPPKCHPEHVRCAQGKLREGSVTVGYEMLRCAQDDSPERWILPPPDCYPAPRCFAALSMTDARKLLTGYVLSPNIWEK
jgi:hypothetical protein